MDVVALLPRPLLAQLESILRPEHALEPACDWDDLRALLDRTAPDVLVADPLAGAGQGSGCIGIAALEDIIARAPATPVIVYTSLSPVSLRAVARLARSGVEHVVLHRFDDDRRQFRQMLERVPAVALGDRMLQELAGPLSKVPFSVVRAIEQLYRAPKQFRTASDLAGAAGMPLRALYRHLSPAGLPSIRALVVSARLLKAYSCLRDTGRPAKAVASETGCHSPWQLSQHMREMTGRTTEQVRRDLAPEELVGLLVRRVLQETGDGHGRHVRAHLG